MNSLWLLRDAPSAAKNDRTVVATVAGDAGRTFNVSINESVFVYKRIVIDRPPLGPGGDDVTDDRGSKRSIRTRL